MMYVRARGLRRRGARLLLAMAVQTVLPSPRRRGSALQIPSFRRSITLPIRTATDASPVPSRTPTHGSRWVVERLLLLPRGLSPPIICQLAWRSRRRSATSKPSTAARHRRRHQPAAGTRLRRRSATSKPSPVALPVPRRGSAAGEPLRRRYGQGGPTTMAGARRERSSMPANAALRGHRYGATTGSRVRRRSGWRTQPGKARWSGRRPWSGTSPR